MITHKITYVSATLDSFGRKNELDRSKMCGMVTKFVVDPTN
jgi:hypothetical protein